MLEPCWRERDGPRLLFQALRADEGEEEEKQEGENDHAWPLSSVHTSGENRPLLPLSTVLACIPQGQSAPLLLL